MRKNGATRLCQMLTVSCAVALVTSVLTIGAVDAQDVGGSVAIVVHSDVDIDELSMDRLRRIFLAEQQYWPDNSRIVLLVRAPAAYERTVVLERIYRMTEDQFRRYWIAKIFRAEIPSGPKVVLSTNMARELVSVIPSSITFMLAADVGPDSKIIRVDGKLPDEDGYPLM